MNEEQSDQQDDLPQDQRDGQLLTAMVQQANGGALMRGGHVRPKDPTPNDCRLLLRKRFYQVIPALNRIARNASKRTKTTKALKRSFRVADQIAAIRTLAQYSMSETIPAEDVRVAIRGTIEDFYDMLPREQADALKHKIAPRWFGL